MSKEIRFRKPYKMLRDVEIFEALRIDDLAYILTVRYEKPLLNLPKDDSPTGLMRQMTLVQAAAYFGAEKCFFYFYKRMNKLNISSDQVHLIHFAAIGGSLNIINAIIERFDVINKQDADKNTPLHYAIKYNQFDVVKFLIENHANTNIQNSDGLTPGHIAAMNGNLEILKLLFESGSDLKIINSIGWFPLNYAIKYQHNEVALFLILKQCFDPSIQTFISIAQQATSYKMTNVVRALINLGVNTFIPNHNFWTIVHYAAASGNVELFTHIYNAFGPKPFFAVDRLNRNAAHIAAINGQLEIIQAIENMGINMFGQGDKQGMTPFLSAVECGRQNIIEYLIKKSDLTTRDRNLRSCLHIAVESDDIRTCAYLMENGADPNMTDARGRTPLFLAVQKRLRNPIIVLLLQNGADPNICPKEGHTILSCAVVKNPDALTVLLAAGADPAMKDANGWNVLHYAAVSSPLSVFNMLIGDPSIKALLQDRNNKGETPFWLACANGKVPIVVDMITKFPEMCDVHDNKNVTPLMVSIKRGHSEVAANILARAKIDINAQDENDMTALHYAVESWMNRTAIELSNIVRMHVNIRDNRCLSAFMLACKLGNTELVANLIFNPRIRCDFVLDNGMNAANLAALLPSTDLLQVLFFSKRVDMEIPHDGVIPLEKFKHDYYNYHSDEEAYSMGVVSEYAYGEEEMYEEEEEFPYSDTEHYEYENEGIPLLLQEGDVIISNTRDNLLDNQEK